jgi:hypothetical protein
MMGKLSFEKHQRRLFSQDNSSALKSQVRPTSHGELKLNERDERRDGGKNFSLLSFTGWFSLTLSTRLFVILSPVVAVV